MIDPPRLVPNRPLARGRPLFLSAPPPPPRVRQGGTAFVREISDTSVIVLALVLILKLFLAEAYLIPTGSMAPTMLGYHLDVTCPQCGIAFPVNCSIALEPPLGSYPNQVVSCTCPSCWQAIDLRSLARQAPCSSGDRVLVSKMAYDLSSREPRRLDVVVFKFPGEPEPGQEPMNYVKRLWGLPGESIALHGGDVFVYPPEQERQIPLTSSNPSPPSRAECWQPRSMYPNDPRAQECFRQGRFQRIAKPPDKVLALRRLVHDQDYAAVDPDGRRRSARWSGETGWQERADCFATEAGLESLHWLHYRHQDPSRSPAPRTAPMASRLITDFLAYNSWEAAQGWHMQPPSNWVGDLILECEVDLHSISAGALILELVHGVDRFQARWSLPAGDCSLVRQDGAGEYLLACQPTPVSRPGVYRLRFANVDRRLIVWINERLAFGAGIDYVPPEDNGPTAADLQPAGIAVRQLGLTLRHLQLWRDVYFTLAPATPDALNEIRDWGYPQSWGPLHQLPCRTFFVQPGHYFCLGDNSAESSDSRSWGLVPEAQLVGRALWTYYPPHRFGPVE